MEDVLFESFGASPQLYVNSQNLYIHNVSFNDGYGTNGQIIVDGNGCGGGYGPLCGLISTGGSGSCFLAAVGGSIMRVINGGTYSSGPGDYWALCGGSTFPAYMLFTDATSKILLNSKTYVANSGSGQHGISNAGTLVINGSDIVVGTPSGGAGVAISNTGTVLDYGRWSLTAGSASVSSSPTSTWTGPQTLQGSCSGVATSSVTIGLYDLGQNALLTCTSLVVNLGKAMNKSGTLAGLICTADTGGVPADTCTVVKNGAASAITCNIGVGTSCADFTHPVAYIAGDVIGVEIVTGVATTLANVKASVVKN
jgi:hypothetical protein